MLRSEIGRGSQIHDNRKQDLVKIMGDHMAADQLQIFEQGKEPKYF